jgi:ParB/RepB/Spo0J family partition protein
VTSKAIKEVPKGSAPEEFVGQVVRIPTKRVKPLPGQPRHYFNAEQLKRLRDSIAEIGQQSPATVVPWDDGSFRLRDGERRFRCCVDLQIPLMALVVDAKTEEEEFELSTVANLNRESPSPLEKCLAMKRLRDGVLKRTAADIAKVFGVSQQTVANHLLVIDTLPREVLELLDPNKQGGRSKTLQMSVAVNLTALKAFPKDQIAIAQRAVKESLSMTAVLRIIDHFADTTLAAAAGLDLLRNASDYLRALRFAMAKLDAQAKYLARLTQSDIDDVLFEFMPASRHDELITDLETSIEVLTQLKDKVTRVESVGTRLRRAG